jgi:DNA recombination protein RmuC
MPSYWLATLIILAFANLILLGLSFWRRSRFHPESLRPQFDAVSSEVRRSENAMREEFRGQREESARSAASLREEVSTRMNFGLESLLRRQAEAQQAVEAKLESFRGNLEEKLREFGESGDTRSAALRREVNESATQLRAETGQGFKDFQTAVRESLSECSKIQGTQLADFAQRLDRVNESVTQYLEKIRQTIEVKLGELQTKNEQKLEEMRRTVDEKLQGTLERRLSESFKLVSERLEQVHKGLGEMQAMANNVGDLKRVLTNVKVRGTWGEVQLGALLEQLLVREQYEPNVMPKPDSAERVEFAIRLPGSEKDTPIWLPIDAKFPQEDYQRLCEAREHADLEGVAASGKALEARLRGQARDIHDKYIAPPYTTDFAILFLPSEGLYAEALQRPGLADGLQRDYRVVIAGPTTLAAILNSLQMGFRTLAIQKRSSEVWKVLGAVKTEFGRFGEVLAKVKKTLDAASNQIDQTERRTRVIDRTLRDVEALPADQAVPLLPDNVLVDTEEPGHEPTTPADIDLPDIAATQRRLGL